MTAASPTAFELLEQLRATYGDSFADSLAAFASAPSVERVTPVVEAPPSSPEGYWLRAEALLKPLQARLGTLYGPLVSIFTLALLHQKAGETSATFVAPLWVLGVLSGLSRDRVEELLAGHADVLAKFCYKRAWAVNYQPIGKDVTSTSRWAGQVFLVPIPSAPFDEDVIFQPRVAGSRALFTASGYRDLALDVHRRFTEAGWREKHGVERARYGQAKNPGLPSGSRLALLEQLIADRFGRGAIDDARQREVSRLESAHDVLAALKVGPDAGRDGVGRWARAVSEALGTLLGDEARTKVWLSACWAAWRVTRAGLADGFALLYEGVFEVLVRRADVVPRSGSSRGAALNWVLNSLGLRRLDQAARRSSVSLVA
ncbi:hypothetical protein [Deinococcus yavapaiensis]|uniref:Uncharacterized protein n=1 Tax=Deinococcus yavapaiensis KR-236 TaxID=694435 RepID=A0A318S7C3_9DEIO|nr:hypothetical protein [Deinococcus yavapaiensis]PYE50581.1 hypothetical protein DES52_11799 [Deinococcus yavapaiensis KR-236]